MFDLLDKILETPIKTPEYDNLKENMLLNSEDIIQKLLFNLDNLSEEEILDILRKSYTYILDEVSKKNYSFIPMFTNIKFVTSFLQIIRSVQLNEQERITVNKICYDYLTLAQRDEIITSILFNMSRVVNQSVIPGLLGLGLNEQLASYLALARFSSSKDLINVKRVNFIIMSQPSILMTEQMIIDIYSKLFDSVTPLFTGTILDVEEFDEEIDTEDQELVYSTISNAVLDILETLTLDQIRQVLLSYNITRESYYSGKPVRFTMNALSDDYNRINIVNESLNKEGIYLP